MPYTLAHYDGLKLVHRLFETVVDQNIVVVGIVLNLSSRRGQPALNDFLGLHVLALAALAQARFQLTAAGRKHENTHCVWRFLLDLTRALDINVQQQVMTVLTRPVQHASGCAVIVAKNLGEFQKLVAADHLFKLVAANETVFASVLLAAPRRTRSVRNGKLQVDNILAQFVDQSGFARTRGRRDDIEDSAHSRLCTCSRHFSISAFICMPSSVILSPSPATPARLAR